MSVIQKIRDKYARWAAFAIALAIIGFLLMDAFAGKAGVFSNNGPGNTLGKVNGEKIEYRSFLQEMEDQINQYQAQGGKIDENQRQQLMSNMWEQKVTEIIMKEEWNKLGLDVTDKEMRNVLISNPPDQLRQKYTDENGNFNTVQAQQEISAWLKDPKQKEGIRNYLLQRKYMAMLNNTVVLVYSEFGRRISEDII